MDNELWAHPYWARQDGLRNMATTTTSLNYLDMDDIK